MIANSLRAPEVIESDFERFLVHDRFEILSILRRLQVKSEPVTLNLDDGDFVLTILLAVNPDFEEMVFDCGSDPDANRKLMQAERLTLVANIDGIKVQFSVRRPDTTIFEGRPALRMRLPEIMLRLQRRDFYRIPASLACEIALDCDGRVRVLELRVVDLSLGGVAMVTDKAYVDFAVGQVLENCRIGLGTLGTLALDLEVKNLSAGKTRNGLHQSRIGCEFANLERAAETLISRYIGQKERERRSRE
jgi:flagellar brake protein